MNKLLKTRNICVEIMENDEIDIEKKKIRQVVIKREKTQSFFKKYKISTISVIIGVILIILGIIFDLDYFEHFFAKLEQFEIDEVFLISVLIFIILMIDFSVQKLIEKELLKQDYNQAEFYKDILLHDMGNIINNLKSSIYIQEMWKDNSEKLAKRARMMKIIKQQVERGASLISNVRKLSEMEGADQYMKSVDSLSTLENAIEHICIQFLVKEIEIEIENETPQVSFNIKGGDLLIDAFENILINGAFHNDSKKIELWVKTSKVQEEGENFVKIEFKDNGRGIIDEGKKDIFRRNYKKDRNTGGMGLGLSLVKKIISRYDGQVWVEDRVEGDYAQGSNFVILLREG